MRPPLVLLLPRHREVRGQALDQGEQTAATGALDLDAEVEPVEALEVGLDELPAVSQQFGEADQPPSLTP